MKAAAIGAGARRALVGLGISIGSACAAQPAGPIESAPALVETAPVSAASTHGASAPLESSARDALPSIGAEADTSLPLAVYHAAGVPEIEPAWSARDYERCLRVFADLASSGRGDLPRRGSQRSGALFSRLVATENFESAADMPAPERARRLQGYLEVYPGLLQVYAPANDGIDFAVEQTELIVSLFELLKAALASSRPIAADDAAWGDVYARQKAMALGVVRGASAMLAEPERYLPPLREYLKAALLRLAPELETHLEPSAASELRVMLGGASATSRNPSAQVDDR